MVVRRAQGVHSSSPPTCPSGQIARSLCTAPRILGASILLAPASAAASNPWLTPLGSEAAMSGGAVAAMGRDTGNAWYNPRKTRIAYVPAVKVVHHGGHAARKGLRHIGLFVRGAATFFRLHGWKWF